MSNTVIITAQEVIAKTKLNSSTDSIKIDEQIILAKDYIDSRLNNNYVIATHGKEIQYRHAICQYVYYLMVDIDSFVQLSGVGRLAEREIDIEFLNKRDLNDIKDGILQKIESFLAVIINTMKDKNTDLDTSDSMIRIAGLTLVSSGGNSSKQTDYGDGWESNDDNIRG